MAFSDRVEQIRSNIETSLRSCGLKSSVVIVNFGNCICVDDENMYLWVRLIPCQNNFRYQIEISSISLVGVLRRRGIFTKVYTNLRRCDAVAKVCITSVCSFEMLNWCKKNGLSTGNGFDFC